MESNKNEITYTIIEKLAVLRKRGGYTKELRIVDWNGIGPRLDLREWSPDGKCGKGITFTDDEARQLYRVLGHYFSKELVETDDEDLPFDK